MTTATRSVAVVATRLPNIDRRALSQAQYSALHLPQNSRPGSMQVGRSADAPVPLAASRSARAASGSMPLAAPASARGASIGNLLERRGAPTDLARRFERVLAKHALRTRSQPGRPVPTSAALAVKVGDGRIALLVRQDGPTTRIVALCAPQLRERVDRALAHARFGLAAAGMSVEAAPV